MLEPAILDKIEKFVYIKPRSIQEIAQNIDKSWRTADRYTQEIEKEYGTLATRTFRGGTRGALKIVYWASIEKAHSSVFQEKLAKDIEMFKNRTDFSAFDIYQHVPAKNKKVSVEQTEKEAKTDLKEYINHLRATKKQLLVFSGNLSWTNLKNKEVDVFKVIEDMVKKGISIKVLCRVDLVSLKNIEKMLSLNFKYGKEIIEIRHCEHPLRSTISDNKIMRLKEVKEPKGKDRELKNSLYIFYTIKDKDWAEWGSRVFWNLFSNSINARKRIEELNNL